ncbi:MAG: hypothetical protein J6T97_05125 [Bacteroidaceae bacterium]|nr:hypothetical protein [Bacteroidaceae bacterium]
MKRFKSLTNRSGLFGAFLAVMATVFGLSSCRPDFDLDKRMPEWLGTSIYETLKEGFRNDSTGVEYSFNTFVRLIEDLDQVNILAKTGSKTLFVADDSAFARFFRNCPFTTPDGQKVTSYDQLSAAQKTMILNGSMLNNVYQVAMLSSSPGGDNTPPILGSCMRRVSASSVLDTIPVVKASDLPKGSKFWNRLRTKNDGKSIVLLQDGTNKPIIFFVNKFLQSNKIDNDDYDFLFRLGKYSKVGKPAHRPGDASVNGTSIEWPNKKCFNGFLHVMADVVYLLPNMADYIATNPNSRIYSSILDRFSVPQYSRGDRIDRDENIRMLLNSGLLKSQALEDAMTANGDSVFVKKYVAKRSRLSGQNVSATINSNFDGIAAQNSELLKFDPGWNSFISSTNASNTDVALQQDMGLMFVPEDQYLMEWWLDESQLGARLRARYGLEKYKGRNDLTVDEVIEDMSGIELSTIAELVNNNMQYSLVGSVPSKFSSVLNDAQDPFFEDRTRAQAEETIDDVVMCCNGAVFFTKTVYVPTAYRSVAYPVLVNEKLKIIDWAIREDDKLAFKAYLNSMVAEYSFFVPMIDTIGPAGHPELKNKLVWIDPAAFYLKAQGTGRLKAVAFSYGKQNPDDPKETAKVMGRVYDFDETTGELTDFGLDLIPGMTKNSQNQDVENNATLFIRNRILDLMDYHIIIGNVEAPTVADPEGYSYFRTKGRGTIRFKNVADPVNDYGNMTIEGGWQIENEGQADAIQRPVKVLQRVDLSKTSLTPGNGRTYIIDRPLLPSRKSVYDVVSDATTYPEFEKFFKLMWSTGVFAETSNTNKIGSAECISSFNTYHYTVYVPQNDSIQALFDRKVLWDEDSLQARETLYNTTIRNTIIGDYEEEADYDYNKVDSVVAARFPDYLVNLSVEMFGVADSAGAKYAASMRRSGEKNDDYNARYGAKYFTNKKRSQMKNFVKYHIQDNSVYIGADFNAGIDDRTGLPAEKAQYETAYMNSNQQFEKLTVKGGDGILITDKAGNTRQVLKTKTAEGKPYYNIMCREYEIKGSDGSTTLTEGGYDLFSIETSSYAVVHLIDAPLSNGEMNF